jgi:hypothetical protein
MEIPERGARSAGACYRGVDRDREVKTIFMSFPFKSGWVELTRLFRQVIAHPPRQPDDAIPKLVRENSKPGRMYWLMNAFPSLRLLHYPSEMTQLDWGQTYQHLGGEDGG